MKFIEDLKAKLPSPIVALVGAVAVAGWGLALTECPEEAEYVQEVVCPECEPCGSGDDGSGEGSE